METKVYMDNLVLLPINDHGPNRSVTGNLAICLECFALTLNIIVFYLVKKQGFKTLDMWFASILSLGDSIFVMYKLAQLVAFKTLGIEKVFLNYIYGQIDGCFETFMVLSSLNCVGILALLRLWAIYFKRKPITVYWVAFFIFEEMIALCLLMLTAFNKEYILMPIQRYFYPNTVSPILLTRIAVCVLITSNVFNCIVVNICYPLLYSSFIKKIRISLFTPGTMFYTLKRYSQVKKRNLFIKTSIMLLLYNVCMIPHLFLAVKEQITNTLRSYSEDVIISTTAMFLFVINPLILLILHDGTYNALKDSIEELKFKISNLFTY